MNQGILQKRPHLIPSLVASIMSLLLLADWSYNYFWPFRAVMFCFALYVAYMAYQWGKMWAACLFGFIASLWLIIDSRELWKLIDIICALLFIVIAFIMRKPAEEKNAPRHLREGFGLLAITGILAITFFVGSINSFVEAKTNQNGGYIPITAGREGDYIGDEWVDAAQYKRHKLGKGMVYLFISVVSGWGFIYVIVKEKPKKNEIAIPCNPAPPY